MSKPVDKLGYNLNPSKIIKNLDSSRQKWRQKALTRYQLIRQLEWRIRDLEQSRDAWRCRAFKEPNPVAEFVVCTTTTKSVLQTKEESELYLAGHPYSLWQMECSVKLYLCSNMGYRTIAQNWMILSPYLDLATPSFSVIRQWVLRLGYYQLCQPIEQADDWVYILDYTLQMGLEQCLVILGLRLNELRCADHWELRTQDVQVLDVSLTHWPNAAHIAERLNKVVAQTSPPIQIVADGARTIRNGIQTLSQSLNQELLYTYDISHLVALQLKKLLQSNEQWQQLVKALNQVQKSTAQTTAGFLTPPSLRRTARYMNLFKVVEWTSKLLAYKDQGDFDLLATNQLTTSAPNSLAQDGQAQFQKRFAPIMAMRPFLLQLQQLMELVKWLLFDFKHYGLSKSQWACWKQLPTELLEPLAQNFWTQSKEDLYHYIEALPDNEKWLATSDIIESIFGRYKAKGEKYWLKGITPNILFIPALVGKFDNHTMKKALKYSSYQDVISWFKNHRKDDSFLAKRRKALAPPSKRLKMVGTFPPPIFCYSTA